MGTGRRIRRRPLFNGVRRRLHGRVRRRLHDGGTRRTSHSEGRAVRAEPRGGVRATVGVALLLLLLVFLLPVVFLSGRQLPPEAQATARETPPPPQPAPPPKHVDRSDNAQVRVLMQDGSIFVTPMYDYLWHVVAAEMPASFEPAALCAQTVAARTYALRKMQQGEPNHPDADVCTDIACCQAFITRAGAAGLWGESAEAYSDKVAAAVRDTAGVAVTYQGEVIDAVFHSSSAARTADAVEVWGAQVPYLVGVETPEGDSDVPNYHSTVTVSAAEFKQLMTDLYPQARLEGSPTTWFQNMKHTPAGVVDTLEVGGVALRGTQLRTMCALRSARFDIRAGEHEIVFTVTAYGHGVGMSQYGANTLAKQGKTWQEILRWYYTGVEITKM